jgi:hypothetical protein
VPVPDNNTVWGLLPPESVNDSVAERDPGADGVKLMLTRQLAEPASVAPQVFVAIAKSEALAPEIAMLVKDTAAVLPLLSVVDWGELVEPTTAAVNVRLVGMTLTMGAFAIPESVTVCGLFPAESLNETLAMRVPTAVGVNIMLTVQLAEPARLAPQVLAAIVKSPPFAPEMLMRAMLMAAVPVLLKVIDCGELEAPTVVPANVRLPGKAVALGRLPVPVNATVCGLFAAESVNVSVAVRVPTVEGVNATLTVQLADPPTVVPQVFAEIAKSDGSAPVTAIPSLWTVIVCAALLEPTLVGTKESEAGLTVAVPAATVPTPERETAAGE